MKKRTVDLHDAVQCHILIMKTFNDYLNKTGEIGFIESVNNSVISVSGLPKAKPQELVVLESGDSGFILNLNKDSCDILLFSKNPVRTGSRVTRTEQVFSIKASVNLLGKTVDPFGQSLKLEDAPFRDTVDMPVDLPPPGISMRKRINQTLQTGVAVVDLILPLGKGQRQLIIGDRKTGKTSFLMQSMIMQAKQGSICIYVAIGKKQLSYKRIEEYLEANGIMKQCVIVASNSEDAPAVVFLAPYAGMTLAEYFLALGNDVFIILDDLTTHARYYRQISLLTKRFPGRNSYPADIFYAHSRLLERAGNFNLKTHDGSELERSITCFPVAETVQGDLSGYIQTNLMAITDGHLYFDFDLFGRGRRPPIHPFLSVTRTGRQTQDPLRQTLNREIFSFLSLYEKMQNFAHFGAEVSNTVTSTLQTGSKITVFFDYISSKELKLELQIILFSLLWVDIWREKSADVMKKDIDRIINLYDSDEAFRSEISTMLKNSDSFNKLLGEIRGKPDEFYKKLGF